MNDFRVPDPKSKKRTFFTKFRNDEMVRSRVAFERLRRFCM